MTPELYRYYRAHTIKPNSILEALQAETQELPIGGMQISDEQGAFIQLLLKIMGAKKVLEIGTFTGYSALCMALALPDDGQVITCDINVEWTDIARRYWEVADVNQKIDLKMGPAVETMQSLLKEGHGSSFDFIFIDADKANYTRYYEMAVELVRVGGVIAVDNVLWYGSVANLLDTSAQTRAIRSLNDQIYQDARVELSMLPIGDGMTLAMRRK